LSGEGSVLFIKVFFCLLTGVVPSQDVRGGKTIVF
jgi:hypothetical protein